MTEEQVAKRDRTEQTAEAFYRLLEQLGRPPTIREVGDAVGVRSSNTAHTHMMRAAQRGLIRYEHGRVPAFWPMKHGLVARIATACATVEPTGQGYGLARQILALIEGDHGNVSGMQEHCT
jgi:SOS-response transcriptional repressor LexA